MTAERAALRDAVKIAYLYPRQDLVAPAIDAFFAARLERYKALAKVVIPSQVSPAGVSCQDAEAIMELEEGVPDYIALQTLRGTAMITDLALQEFLAADKIEPYYQFGAMQLLLLQWKLGKAMPNAVAAILAAEGPDKSIGFVLKQHLHP